MGHYYEKRGIDMTGLFVFMAYLAISITSVFFVIYLYSDDSFVVPELNVISAVSLIYFIFLCLAGLTVKRYYFFVFPFLILTVPNAVNDLLPNFLMGPVWERNSSAFAFFTHIDFYLFFGVFRFYKDVDVKKEFVALFVSVYFVIFFMMQILNKFDSDGIGPYLFGLYQFRYFLLLFLVVSFFNIQRDFKYFFWGICLAAIILVLESFVTTYIRGGGFGSRLGSGNFAVNVYGNLLAALTLFLYFGRKHVSANLYVKMFVYICMFTLVSAMIMTGTKGSLFSLLVAFVLLWRFSGIKSKSCFVLFYSLGGLAILLCAYFLYQYVDHLISIDTFNDSYIYDTGTSSLHTRVVLWGMTIDMIKDHYLLGIGNGLWNYMKYDYGSPFDVLLDPHNDYLSYIVNYGLSGLVVVFFFYMYPLYKIVFLKGKAGKRIISQSGSYIVFVSFIIPFAISAFTNANTLKHQVFALFCFFLLCAYKFHQGSLFGRKGIRVSTHELESGN